MSWVVAGMAGLGMLQGAANQKKMERQNKYREEVLRYSPWTGMGDPGEKQLPDALQSGLQGAAMGAALGNLGGGGGTKTPMAGSTEANTAAMGLTPEQAGMNPQQFNRWALANLSE